MPYLCLLQEDVEDYVECLKNSQDDLYTVIAVPIDNKNKKSVGSVEDDLYPDTILPSEKWNNKVILMLSDDINCDSEDPYERKISEEALEREVSWAAHLQFAGYVMVRLNNNNNTNLARLLSKSIKGNVIVRILLKTAKPQPGFFIDRPCEHDNINIRNEFDPWHWWKKFHALTNYSPKVKVVIEVHPDEILSKQEVLRWLGEPLEGVIVPSQMFIKNANNYPVLPKVWQNILIDFVQMHKHFFVNASTTDCAKRLYAEYLKNFMDKHEVITNLDGFEDLLEIPLQPLHDNLDYYTYEIFERDPTKYEVYKKAITAALQDRVTEAELETKLTIIMVLGAGRGPLVRAALEAADDTKRKVRIYVIEKNPNAIRTLNAFAKDAWAEKDVHIFSKDMRLFAPPEKADIIVSELLGSFGDNELSPECLDCALKLLKEDGISIPCKSISFINPIMSTKLYTNLRHLHHRAETISKEKNANHDESAFVVHLKSVYNIANPQALFEFWHPNREEPINNARHKTVQFEVQLDCVLNGIAGYFTAVLYKDIILSINPMTYTPYLTSWFPMFFPISKPMNLKKGDIVEINFWRCVSRQKVWYEWCISEPYATAVHNQNGISSPIYL